MRAAPPALSETGDSSVDGAAGRPELTPAAQRALAEAEARRIATEARIAGLGAAVELGGRDGPDPVRYNDWENNGIASDF